MEGQAVRVTLELPNMDLGAQPVLLRIRTQDGKPLGKLWIGKGNVWWARAYVADTNAKKRSVRSFVKLLNEQF
jgi:hypothetical protein